MKLDTVTMLIALGIVSGGFSLAMLLAWRFLLPQKPLLFWSSALGFHCAGIFLIAFRVFLPDLISILLANLLLVSCYGMLWAGMCHYRGIKPYYKTLLTAVLLYIPIIAWFTWIDPDIPIRIIAYRVFVILCLGASVATLRKKASGIPLSLMEKATIGGLLLDAAFRMLNILVQLSDMSYDGDHFYRNAIVTLSASKTLIGITAWSLASIVMMLEKAVEEKEKTEEIFKQFMRNTPIYTYIKQVCGGESVVLHASANYLDMLGIPAEAMIGKSMRELFPAAIAEQITRDDLKIVETGDHLSLEEQFNGRSYTTLKFPIPLPSSPGLIAGFTIDITDRKEVEDEWLKFEVQDRQLKKAESLGRMAGAIAHKFNNLLGAVLGNLELAINELTHGVTPLVKLTEAMKAANRAAEVSSLMLTYLGQTPVKLEPLDLAEACRSILPTLRIAMPQGVTIEAELPSAGPTVRANEHQLQQLVSNLATNAWESLVDSRGTIQLSLRTVTADTVGTTHRFPLDWQPQESLYACLEIADSGCGIDEADLDKLFDPFFTTKFTGRGLGLAVVLGIVRGHRGGITVESSVDRGSIMRIFLPLTDEEVTRQPVKEAALLNVTPGGTVLLIEDEQQVREMTKSMLAHLGFAVLEAKDGIEAVGLYGQYKDKVRLVLCDLNMSGMDGWETLRALRRLKPGIPAILTSGYDQAEVMTGNHPEWPQAFLGKPFGLSELGEAINKALETAA